jgi:putative acetyltransferase
MNVAFETPDQPEVLNLIAELDAFHLSLYPPESVYALDLASLKQSNVLFAVARGTSQAAIGCGAIVVTPEYGELKRMYVQPDARGQGVAKKLLGTLESAAKAGLHFADAGDRTISAPGHCPV